MLFNTILWVHLFATLGASLTLAPDKRDATVTSACTTLSLALPGQVYVPGSTNYTTETEAFFSKTEWLSPYCVFAPLSAQDLATGVTILVSTNTSFAIRSGGHAAVRGLASTDSGVMIATTHFTETTLVNTPNAYGVQYLRAGAGFRWQELYEFLNPYGLSVVGGRVAPVGSSLLLGGGLSYMCNQYGWAANNVVNYELVTADGTILEVNAKSHPDLFWALKGGSNNFGIVTRYDLRTVERGPIFGGSQAFAANATQQYLEAHAAYLAPGGGLYDYNGNVMPSFGYTPLTGETTSGIFYYYDQPVQNPKAFENFTVIPSSSSNTGIMNFTTFVAQTEFFAGLVARWSWYDTAMYLADGNETVTLVTNTVVNNAKQMLANVTCSVGWAIEPITVPMMENAVKSGGDAIDLDPSRGGFAVIEIYASWQNESDDAATADFLAKTLSDIEAKAKAKNLYYPFTWLNDAGIKLDPIATYGYGASLPKMKAISKQYDPAGVFQKLVPGFKLGFELAG